MEYIVYKITNTVNSKLYFGITQQSLIKRWQQNKQSKKQTKFIMKDLNKYNTALDLSNLNEDEMKEFFNWLNTINQISSWTFEEFAKEYNDTSWYFDNEFNEYLDISSEIEYNVDLKTVDFQTFKQIHFTR